ncbi:MAG: XkdF-like putative serine protease domain-containing protein [Synergistaceae bacterium]|nr:XkdF-like putative serine protease domain-containing protein [Synergistaceae bacterium]
MPTELKEMRVDFISLVSKGANGKKVIWKSGIEGGGNLEAFETPLKKVKKSDEKRVVYGIVYSPEQVDSQGEYASREEIEKAAYGFMKGLKLLNVDARHDFDPKGAFVAESWIIKGADSLFPDEPEGSWAAAVRVEDNALWEDVKKGSLAGLSMAGYAAKVKKGEEGFMAKMEELLARVLKGAGGKEAKEAKEAEDGKVKKAEPAEADAEEIAKIASALENIPSLLESVVKLDERLKTLETATPGQMSKGVDGSADGISFA